VEKISFRPLKRERVKQARWWLHAARCNAIVISDNNVTLLLLLLLLLVMMMMMTLPYEDIIVSLSLRYCVSQAQLTPV